MGIIEKFLPQKTDITADTIRAEIARAEGEIATLHVKLSGALAHVASMSDSEHVAAEANIAATKRAITRLDARIGHLTAELPNVVAAEEAAAKASADTALGQRAEAARKANTSEAKKLLAEYDSHAAKVAGVLARLDEIATEANAVNEVLRLNPVADHVPLYDAVHRRNANRRGYYELPLLEVLLPPGFYQGAPHWPRRS